MGADGIAELQGLLQAHCDALSGASDKELVFALEGRVPEDVPDDAGDESLFESPAPSSSADIVAGNAGPRWVPLALGLPPGVKQIVGLIQPPLQVIVVVLRILAAFVSILKVILLGILDPFAALVKAAISALQAIITDLLGAGGYLYWDVPGLTSPDVTAQELGLAPDLVTSWEAGLEGKAGPTVAPQGIDKWLGRFKASFDDAGDEERPRLSDGATIEAFFIVGAAPNLDLLSRLANTLGRLLNLDGLDLDWDKFFPDAPDTDQAALNATSVAPDWEKFTLLDLIPDLEALAGLPKQLEGLLLKVDGVVAMIEALADGIQKKIELLLAIADMIQGIIDLLESLSAAGLYVLPVSTQDGIEGLYQAATSARDRPPGEYVAGACLLAAGPGLADFAMIGSLFTAEKWRQTAVEAAAPFLNEEGGWEGSAVHEGLQAISDYAEDEAAAIWEDAVEAGEAFGELAEPSAYDHGLGAGLKDLGEAYVDAHASFGDDLIEKIEEQVGPGIVTEDLEGKVEGQTQSLISRGRRSLAGAYADVLEPVATEDEDEG